MALPREMVELIQNFPPSKFVYRDVNVFLKDGSQRSDVVVIGGEFYAMDTTKHAYFSPDEIVLVEAATTEDDG